jgi:hypothetical protein
MVLLDEWHVTLEGPPGIALDELAAMRDAVTAALARMIEGIEAGDHAQTGHALRLELSQ